MLAVRRREAPWGGEGQEARARWPNVQALLLCALLLLFMRKKRRRRERKGKEEKERKKKWRKRKWEKFKTKKILRRKIKDNLWSRSKKYFCKREQYG
jgi:hypothetical protein